MAYAPDVDRFYAALAGAGQDYQKYRDKVAEDQAATTQALGQIYGQALPNTVNSALAGANWSMKRAEDQQKMDLAQNADTRAQTVAGQQTTKFGWDSQDHDMAMAAAQKAAAYDAAPATEEEASMAGQSYVPGMTHADVKARAAVQALGKDSRDLDFKKQEEEGRNTRQTAELTSAEQRAADALTGENSRAAAVQYGDNMRQDKTIAAQKDLEGLKLSAVKPKPAPAETLNKLSDADSAEKALDSLADEWKDKASGKTAGIAQYIPGTDAKKYDDALNLHATTVASFLKGGRGSPTPADIDNAKNLLPSAGDSATRAEEKLDRMSAMIAERKRAHLRELQTAHFDTGDLQATGTGTQFNLKKKTGKNGVAYGGDNEDLSPEDLQDAMVQSANAPAGPKPLHQMTIDEKKAELRARGIPVDD